MHWDRALKPNHSQHVHLCRTCSFRNDFHVLYITRPLEMSCITLSNALVVPWWLSSQTSWIATGYFTLQINVMAVNSVSQSAASESTHESSSKAPHRNGYMKTCVVSLRQDSECGLWERLILNKIWTSQKLRSVVSVGSLTVFLALVVKCVDWETERASDTPSASFIHFLSSCAGELLLSLWHVISPVLTLTCAFFWVGLYLIRCGILIRTSLFLLTVCHLGEAAARCLFDGTNGQTFSLTSAVVVLACLASGALMVLRLKQGVSVIIFISVLRTISLISLNKVRGAWRPYLAYLVGVLGVLLARYADKVFPKEGIHREGCTSVTGSKEEVPVFKRRRRSSSVISSDMAHSQSNSKSHRRTSLPCLQRDQVRNRSSPHLVPFRCGLRGHSIRKLLSTFGHVGKYLALSKMEMAENNTTRRTKISCALNSDIVIIIANNIIRNNNN